MNRTLYPILAVLLAIIALHASAETLTQYVTACKQQVGFTTLPNNLNCSGNGQLFAIANDPSDPESSPATNDYVGHVRINDTVDLVFACRWVGVLNSQPSAFSIELMVHNRQNGSTCFFEANDDNPPGVTPAKKQVSANIVSPTAINAANYWKSPAGVDSELRCVGCHTSGPYIASARIAPFLAQFGLLNNGHDTFDVRFHAVSPAGGAFSQWDAIARGSNVSGTCADACHTIGEYSTGTGTSAFGFVLVPSLASTITDVINSGEMPANNGPFNDYIWVNMDTPTNGGTGDYETLVGLEQQYPNFYCSNPANVEAQVVDSGNIFTLYDVGDKLRTLNMRDGLVCLNSDQPNGGTCHDYRTRYFCNGAWTGWYNTDSPGTDSAGDHEERSRDAGLCASPTAMQYAINAGSTTDPEWIWFGAPNDRLAEFDSNGLICRNADQGTGQKCSNYAVRFNCAPATPAPAATPLAPNVNSGNIGTAEKTYVVTTNINGWQASNTAGRKIYINGVPMNPGQTPLPPKTMDGKYYFTFTAGGNSFASWSFW